MQANDLMHFATEALCLVLLVSAPVLIASAVVGQLIGVWQSATQIQEPVLPLIFRLAAAAVVIVVEGAWGAGELVRFTSNLWTAVPDLV